MLRKSNIKFVLFHRLQTYENIYLFLNFETYHRRDIDAKKFHKF